MGEGRGRKERGRVRGGVAVMGRRGVEGRYGERRGGEENMGGGGYILRVNLEIGTLVIRSISSWTQSQRNY